MAPKFGGLAPRYIPGRARIRSSHVSSDARGAGSATVIVLDCADDFGPSATAIASRARPRRVPVRSASEGLNMRKPEARRMTWQSLALALGALGVGCMFAKTQARDTGSGGGGSGGVGSVGLGGGGSGGGGGAGGRTPPNIGGFPGTDGGIDAGPPPLTDFPADPIIDPSAPANAPSLFAGSTPRAGGAPCITSPIAGTLMPKNWLRPRFDLTPGAGENLFEIDLAVAGFAHPLRIFTANPNTALGA